VAGIRILVVDHSATAALVIQAQARDWGMHCEIAASGAAAMVALKSAAVARTPYDVALIEMQNGSTDGLTLGRAIKAEATLAHCRVIGMYSLGTRPGEDQVRAAGIRALLIKPIKQTQLFNVLSVATSATAEAAAAGSNVAHRPARRRRVSELKSQLPAEVRSRIRILLAEDNLVNQQVQSRMLERIGFRLIRSTTAARRSQPCRADVTTSS
jgi:two-component system sensor histidine kinase/response regulator